MKDNKNKIKRRVCRKRAGFTLMELLLAMTVMLLFTMVMTSLMNTATAAYKHSISCSNADVFISNTVNRLRLELSDARNARLVSPSDLTGDNPSVTITTGGYTLKSGVVYTDASTGAECLIFINETDEQPPLNNLYISKYGAVSPLVNTTDGLMLSVSGMERAEKSMVFRGIEVYKDDIRYSSLDEVTVKLK